MGEREKTRLETSWERTRNLAKLTISPSRILDTRMNVEPFRDTFGFDLRRERTLRERGG